MCNNSTWCISFQLWTLLLSTVQPRCIHCTFGHVHDIAICIRHLTQAPDQVTMHVNVIFCFFFSCCSGIHSFFWYTHIFDKPSGYKSIDAHRPIQAVNRWYFFFVFTVINPEKLTAIIVYGKSMNEKNQHKMMMVQTGGREEDCADVLQEPVEFICCGEKNAQTQLDNHFLLPLRLRVGRKSNRMHSFSRRAKKITSPSLLAP